MLADVRQCIRVVAHEYLHFRHNRGCKYTILVGGGGECAHADIISDNHDIFPKA